jgi:hypothetical protein
MSRVDLLPKIELKNSLNPILYLFLLLFTKLIECAKLLIFIQITHFCAVYLM